MIGQSFVLCLLALTAGGIAWSSMTGGKQLFREFALQRARVYKHLESMTGKDLVIVRYSPGHHPYEEWVYNRADIDAASVVWARESPRETLDQLIRYFADRQVWLLEPDHASGPLLRPYEECANCKTP